MPCHKTALRFFVVGTAMIFCLVAPAHSAHAADRLFMKNGDKLTGTIQAYTNGSVEIKTSYGALRVPTEQLGGVAANDPAVQKAILAEMAAIKARQEDAMKKIAAATPPNQVPPSTPQPQTSPEKVTKAPEQKKDEHGLWGAKWSGNANLGAGLTSGNSDTSSIKADAELKARWEKQRVKLSADYNREKDSGNITVNNRSAGVEHDYFFAPKWFVGSKAAFEQDDIADLDLRTDLSTGLGYQMFEQDDLNLSIVAGPGYQREKFNTGITNSKMTANWRLDYNQKFFDDSFRLFHKHQLNAPIDDFNAFLLQSKSGVSVPLRKGVIASGEVDFDWDNAPAAGTKKQDTTYSLKLGYEW